jgi:hypothetical protein
MSDFVAAGRRARKELDAIVLRSSLAERVEARLFEGEPRRPQRRWRWAIVVAAAVPVMAAALALFWAPRPLTFTIDGEGQGRAGVPFEAAEARKVLAFSDGTTVELRPRARGSVVTTARRGAEVALEHGTLQASV